MICIMSFPRTGSSMTAGLFAKHGVWVGPCKEADNANKNGYFENLNFKKFAIKNHRTGIHRCKEFDPHEDIAGSFKGATNPWLFKGSTMYWKMFQLFSPDYICVRRNKEACLASNKRAKLFSSASSASYDYHYSTMDMLVAEKGGTNVYTDEIIKGDYSSLEKAFKACGLEFNKKITDEFVSPALWHSK